MCNVCQKTSEFDRRPVAKTINLWSPSDDLVLWLVLYQLPGSTRKPIFTRRRMEIFLPGYLHGAM